MEEVKTYIERIKFNNGTEVDLSPGEVILFVGPNNVGKSRALNDIYELCGVAQRNPVVVVDSISVSKDSGSMLEHIMKATKTELSGENYRYTFGGMKSEVNPLTLDETFRQIHNYGYFRDMFVSRLETATRLSSSEPAMAIERNQSFSHPIHYAAYNNDCARWLSESFYSAFGQEITANTLHGVTIPLCIGPTIKLSGEFDSEIARHNAYSEIIETYEQIHNQGDGQKSFIGIMLSLMLEYCQVHIIDEPEAFLHPPQARILGQIIGKTIDGSKQAFISTHSEEIVKGLLDACPNKLKIIRITRDGNANKFSVLNNDELKDFIEDPLLKYSNILSSLFHRDVVLCESDSDCKFYSLIESNILKKQGKYSETLYIQCGGKQRMYKISSALKKLNIVVKLVPDIDVLNDKNVFKTIVETYGISWDETEKDYRIIESNINSTSRGVDRETLKLKLSEILKSSNEKQLSRGEIKKITNILKTPSKWDDIKHFGKNAIPQGDATRAFDNLDSILRQHGIFMVPVGQLEGFVRTVGDHGPNWVNNVLEQYPDLDDSIYDEARRFISELIIPPLT